MTRPTVRYDIRAEDRSREGVDRVRRSLRGLRAAFASVGAALSVGALTRFTVEAAKSADEVNKLSTRLGASVEALSEYRFVAQQTGVAVNALETGFQRMTRRVAEAAAGTGEARGALRELGVDAQRLAQLRPEQQFEVLADAFARVESQSDKVRLAFKLFDTEGVALLQTMEGGSRTIRTLREEFRSLGGTLSQDVADQGSRTTDSIGRLRAAFQAAGIELVRIFGPAVQFVADGLANLIPRAARETSRAIVALRRGFVDLAASIAEFFGKDDVAKNLRGLSEAYQREFSAISDAIGGYTIALSDGVRASDYFDDSLKSYVERAKAAKDEQAALNDELAEAKRLFEQTRTPAERLQIELDALNDLLDKGRIGWEVYTRAMTQAEIRYEEATRTFAEATKTATEETNRLLTEIKREVEGFSRELVDSLFDMSKGIKGVFEDLALTIAKFAFKKAVADPLAEALGGLLEGVFKKRAGGGPVFRGDPVVVGERGPELFVPPTGGQIQPGLGGGVNVSFNITSFDPSTSASTILANRNLIVGMIRGAFDRTGSRARLA